MRRSRQRRLGAGDEQFRHPDQAPSPPAGFLDFLSHVLSDRTKTLRLAFLIAVISVPAVAVVVIALGLVHLGEQWVWVLLSALGIGGVATLKNRRGTRNRRP